MTNEIARLVGAIEQNKTFFLVSHVDPDGDAIGSLIALLLLLRRRGKHAVAYDRDGVPEIYRFLNHSHEIVNAVPVSDQFDVAVFLECPTIQRAGAEIEQFIKAIPIWINIDHHVENAEFGHLNIVEPDFCAVAEVVYELFEAMEEPVDDMVAEVLYTAIMTDTGSFKYPNTTARSHEIAARLIKYGVSPHQIYQRVYENMSQSAARIGARAHSTLEINGKISCITITRAMLEETGAAAEDTHDIVNLGRGIRDVEVALLFRETDDGIKVSLRSKDHVDVNEIARRFDGGGHLRAAGCTIKGDMKYAKEQMYAAVRKALQKAERQDGKSD